MFAVFWFGRFFWLVFWFWGLSVGWFWGGLFFSLVGCFSSFKFGKKLDIGKSGESEICVCGNGCDGMCALHTHSHIVLLLLFFFAIVVLLNSLCIG